MIERELYLKRLRQLKDQNLIKVITGIRRCGKSTLLEAFKRELINDGIAPKVFVTPLNPITREVPISIIPFAKLESMVLFQNLSSALLS